MFKFISKISDKTKKIMLSVGTGVVATATMAIGAFAEDAGSGTAQDLSSIVNTAGATLKDQFVMLVNSLVPVLMGIGVVGIGLYACIYLFKMAKSFFAKASQ